MKIRGVEFSKFVIDKNGAVLCFKKIWVPDNEHLRTEIIQNIYDSHEVGDLGRHTMIDILAREFVLACFFQEYNTLYNNLRYLKISNNLLTRVLGPSKTFAYPRSRQVIYIYGYYQ